MTKPAGAGRRLDHDPIVLAPSQPLVCRVYDPCTFVSTVGAMSNWRLGRVVGRMVEAGRIQRQRTASGVTVCLAPHVPGFRSSNADGYLAVDIAGTTNLNDDSGDGHTERIP